MSNRIQRAVMMGLLMLAGVGISACLPSPGRACGDGWCPDGFLCTPVDHVCVQSGCGNAIVEVEADEECDDGNLDDEDDCLSICQLNRCGDGQVNHLAEACDDGNNNNDDGCNNDCTVSLTAYVKASNTGRNDGFGYSVALSADGSTLAVGAWGEDSAAIGIGGDQVADFAPDAGAVYVYARSGPTWSQQAYVKASNPGAGDAFGFSVALSADGSTLAVGARGEDSAATGIGGNQADNSAEASGAVYVFTRSGPTWGQQAYVKASNTDAGDEFGASVALSADGSTLVVGAYGEDSAARGIGGNQDDNSAVASGAVYVFTRSGTTWSQQAYVKSSNIDANDEFGTSVALSADGSTLAVGGNLEDSAATGIGGNQADNSAVASGAVYVFTRSGTTWSQRAYVKASNTGAGDRFGASVALSADGSTLAVGASWEASAATGIDGNQANNSAGASGAVYVFTWSGPTWSQQAYVKASNTGSLDQFGYSVALSADGSILAVGAVWEASAAVGIDGNQADNSAGNAGAAYVFTRSGPTWSQQSYVKASNTGVEDQFGISVALSADGSTLAVGAFEEDSAATGIGGNQADNSAGSAGAVYVYPLPAQQSLSTIAALSEPDAPASAASVLGGWLGP
jgi:cysteine-rich repeat protein